MKRFQSVELQGRTSHKPMFTQIVYLKKNMLPYCWNIPFRQNYINTYFKSRACEILMDMQTYVRRKAFRRGKIFASRWLLTNKLNKLWCEHVQKLVMLKYTLWLMQPKCLETRGEVGEFYSFKETVPDLHQIQKLLLQQQLRDVFVYSLAVQQKIITKPDTNFRFCKIDMVVS